ncbi:hypothetical protein WDW86_08780 [Bdellovibrionota bacterium FG-2]
MYKTIVLEFDLHGPAQSPAMSAQAVDAGLGNAEGEAYGVADAEGEGLGVGDSMLSAVAAAVAGVSALGSL